MKDTKPNTTSFDSYLQTRQICVLVAVLYMMNFVSSCKNKHSAPQEIVNTPEQMEAQLPELIKEMVTGFDENGKMEDSILVAQPAVVKYLYEKEEYAAKWSKRERWSVTADSLMTFIENARLYGLFPEDYHYNTILSIRNRIKNDSLAQGDSKDAKLWSRADVLFTDALVQIIKDVKLGRLQKDSITMRRDSALTNEFYEQQVKTIVESFTISRFINALEPKVPGYMELRAGIKSFLDSAQFRTFTYVPYPVYDSAKFKAALRQRLLEENLVMIDSVTDTSKFVEIAVKKYQEKMNLKVDGKAGGETIRSLNLTDKDKFIRIAISLDKYKMLPDTMPAKYLWVNLPGYHLQLWEGDTVSLSSRVVVGKPLTRTPVLNSTISEMITYPQWNIPESIIIKEILPGLKKSPAYLEKKGYSLLDSKNEPVDPYLIDWSKYKKGIPYRVIQGSGDDNALGVLKFNFPNKYAVYLHDTNQRYLFAQSSRALSHGCVRVQDWQKLSSYILRNDSIFVTSGGSRNYTKSDSVRKWLNNKEKHYIPVRNRISLFIRYFTCEAKNGKLVFYEDIYNEDKWLKDKYFANK